MSIIDGLGIADIPFIISKQQGLYNEQLFQEV